MKLKLLTLFTCVLLLAAFSIPLMQNNMSIPVMPNTILSQIATTAPKDSIEWQVNINNAMGSSIAVTANESYIFVGGANITNATTFQAKPTLWKFNNLGDPIWNTTLDLTGSLFERIFNRIALSPDESSVYAVGVINSNDEPTLVKFDASDGDYIWTYTLSGGEDYQFYSVKVSPDSNTVYIAGSNANLYYTYPTEFYVAAIDASTGAIKPGWPYTIFLNGTYDISHANDLALSPSGDKLYVSGYYSVVNGTTAMKLVALDTSTGSQLWNVTSGAGCKFTGIDISGDGEKIYALEDTLPYSWMMPYYNPAIPCPYANLITVNASNGEIIDELPLSSTIYMFPSWISAYGLGSSLSLSHNESKLYAVANILPVFMGTYYIFMVELDSRGTVTGALLSPNSQMTPSDLAPANDNESVYVVGYQYTYTWVDYYYTMDFSTFLLKGSADPIPISPGLVFLFLFMTLLQFQSSAAQRTNTYILAGVGVAAVAAVAVTLLLVKIYGGK
nr:PQQ-binding-like beta-propeller repeat protein [Candidatus Freyarchaeota archaeon]